MKLFNSLMLLCIILVLSINAFAVDFGLPSYWIALDPGTTQNLNDVWASDSNNVWIVGDSGTVLHYNGTTVKPIDIGVGSDIDLYSIWGRSANEIYITGSNGTQRYFNGSVWSGMGASPHPYTEIITGVWGNDNIMYRATYGGRIQYYDRNWLDYQAPPDPDDDKYYFNDIYVNNSGFYSVGYYTHIGIPFPLFIIGSGVSGPGLNISPTFNNSAQSFSNVWGLNNHIFVTGTRNIGNNYEACLFTSSSDGSNWLGLGGSYGEYREQKLYRFNDVWGPDTNNILAIGNNGAIVQFVNGTTIDGETETTKELKAIFGTSEEDIWIVGNGTILKHCKEIPSTPNLMLPANGASMGSSINFQWRAEYAGGYQIVIASDSDFDKILLSGISDFPTAQISNFTDGTYYWIVRSINSFGISDFSSVHSFTVINGVSSSENTQVWSPDGSINIETPVSLKLIN